MLQVPHAPLCLFILAINYFERRKIKKNHPLPPRKNGSGMSRDFIKDEEKNEIVLSPSNNARPRSRAFH